MFIFSSVQLYKGIGLIPYLLLHHSVHSCLTLRTYPVLRTNIDIWTESKIEQTETFLKIKGVWLVKSAQQKPFILLPLLPDVYKGRSQKSILIQMSTWPNTCYIYAQRFLSMLFTFHTLFLFLIPLVDQYCGIYSCLNPQYASFTRQFTFCWWFYANNPTVSHSRHVSDNICKKTSSQASLSK